MFGSALEDMVVYDTIEIGFQVTGCLVFLRISTSHAWHRSKARVPNLKKLWLGYHGPKTSEVLLSKGMKSI